MSHWNSLIVLSFFISLTRDPPYGAVVLGAGVLAFVSDTPESSWAIWAVIGIHAIFSFGQDYQAEWIDLNDEPALSRSR